MYIWDATTVKGLWPDCSFLLIFSLITVYDLWLTSKSLQNFSNNTDISKRDTVFLVSFDICLQLYPDTAEISFKVTLQFDLFASKYTFDAHFSSFFLSSIFKIGIFSLCVNSLDILFLF